MNARELLGRRITQWTGFDLDRGGRAVVLEKLIAARTKAVRASSSEDYVKRLGSSEDPEVVRLVEGLTVGHTWFFRDQEQTEAIGQILRIAGGGMPASECWVAGCSTGEEAYTIAMLAESMGTGLEILATDINSESLERARIGQYAVRATREVPAPLRPMLHPAGSHVVTVDMRLRQRVRFERHNLLDPPPRPRGGGGWPLIVCRNVLIYFQEDVAAAVVERLARALDPGGYLFLGASEVLRQAPTGFALVPVGNRYALRRRTAASAPQVELQPSPQPPVTIFAAAPPEPPERVDALLERALAKVHDAAYGDAIALCARALESDVLSAEAHLISGIALYMSDDARSAVRALRSALLLDPAEWVASFYLALSYDQLGRRDDALREYGNTEVSSRARREPSRLPALEAWKDEIALLARARSRGRGSGAVGR